MSISLKEIELKKHLVELVELCQEADNRRKKGDEILELVNCANEKIRSGQKLPGNGLSKLKTNASKLLSDSASQLELYQNVLDKIQFIRKVEEEIKTLQGPSTIRRGVMMSMLQDNARSLPVWVGKPGVKVPGLCGAIPIANNEILSKGTIIAALVPDNTNKNISGSSEDQLEDVNSWILAEVKEYNDDKGLYTVEDIDIEEGKERFELLANKLIPLPKWKAYPTCYPDSVFQKGAAVLGLYPQTTCFYAAIVREPPQHIHDDYSLFFEDSSYPEGFAPALKIPQKYVISIHNAMQITAQNQCAEQSAPEVAEQELQGSS